MTRPYFLACLVFAAIAVPSLLVRAALIQRGENLVRLQTTLTADQVALRLESFVEARLSPVRITQEQWETAPIRDEETFRQHVSVLREHVEGLVAVNWIDSDGVIRWVVPPGPNAAARGKSIRVHPVAGPVLAAAEQANALRLSPPLSLYQGGRGFTAYAPLADAEGRRVGYLNAVFRTRPLVDLCLEHELQEGFGVQIHDGKAPLYSVPDAAGYLPISEDFAVTRPIRVGDRTWTLRLTPSASVLRPLETRAPDFLAQAGILLACALAWTSAAYLKARELRRAEEVRGARLQTILEATTDLVGMAAADGRIHYLNRAGREALGIGPDEPLEERLISEFHPPEVTARIFEEAIPTVIEDGSWEGETALRDGTGREFPVSQVLLGHRDEKGGLSYLSTIARDLTEARRRAAERTELLAKLQEKQRLETMGTLAGGIAHDFNNLLMIVRGFSELTLAQLGVEQGGPRENLNQILTACDQAKELIGQILTFARQAKREPEELELVPLVEGVAGLLRATLPLGVALRLELGEGAAVHADRSQLQQVVMNLCVNAVTALDGKGSLEVGILPLRQELSAFPNLRPEETVEIYVRDDGPGMSAEVRARVFDPFFTTRKGEGGTGLGLSVVHGILEAHGGGIEVESTPGSGTTMRVFLPALRLGPGESPPPEEAQAPPATEPPPPGSTAEPARLLIADDQESVIRILQRTLSLAGYDVTAATRPSQVRKLLSSPGANYDLLLTDLTFEDGEEDGVELARDLSQADPAFPILLMTGSNDREPEELKEAGIRDVLLKPFSMTTLQEVLQEHLPRREGE